MTRDEIEQVVREQMSFHHRYNVSQVPKRGRGKAEGVADWLLPEAYARLEHEVVPDDDDKKLVVEDRVFLSIDGGKSGWLVEGDERPGDIPGYDLRR